MKDKLIQSSTFWIYSTLFILFLVFAYGIGAGVQTIWFVVAYDWVGIEATDDQFIYVMLHLFPLSLGLNILLLNKILKTKVWYISKLLRFNSNKRTFILTVLGLVLPFQYIMVWIYTGTVNDIFLYPFFVTVPAFLYILLGTRGRGRQV